MANREAGYLKVPSVICREIGIGEARNLTNDRDERDQIDEQSKDRDGDRKTRGRRGFRQAWRPPARLDHDKGEPGHEIFEGENRRKDTKEWGYQRRAEGGKCKREADGTDAQQRRIGREAEDVATPFCGAYDQRDCGSDGDADAQWPHNGSLPSSVRGRHRVEARSHHGDRIVGSKRYGLIEISRTQYTVGMAHPVPPAPTSESGSPENCADRVTRGFPSH